MVSPHIRSRRTVTVRQSAFALGSGPDRRRHGHGRRSRVAGRAPVHEADDPTPDGAQLVDSIPGLAPLAGCSSTSRRGAAGWRSGVDARRPFPVVQKL